ARWRFASRTPSARSTPSWRATTPRIRSSSAEISTRPGIPRLAPGRAGAGDPAQHDLDRVLEDLLEPATAQAPSRGRGLRLDQAVGERPEHVGDLPRAAGRDVGGGARGPRDTTV